MSRYASQPAFPSSGFSALPPGNRFTRTFPLGAALPPRPNPAAQVSGPTVAPATAAGAQKLAEAQRSRRSVLAGRAPGLAVARGRGVGGALSFPAGRSTAVLAGHWARTKAALMAPAPGPASLPPAMGGPTMQPAAPPPPMDPAAAGGAPPPPMDPAAAGAPPAVDPATGAPLDPAAAAPAPGLTPPAADPMQPPLPANPRLTPPRAFAPSDRIQLDTMAGLFQDQHAPSDFSETPTQALDDELMGMGAKSAWFKSGFETKRAQLGLGDLARPLGYGALGAATSLGASEFDQLFQDDHEFPEDKAARRRRMLLGGGVTGGALGLASVLAPRLLAKQATDRYAGLTPFARGFFAQCHAQGIAPAQTKQAVDAAAARFGGEVASELRAGLEKLAFPMPGAGTILKTMGGGAAKWMGRQAPRAMGAARNLATTPGGRRQLNQMAGGAFMGGTAGETAIGTDAGTVHDPVFGMGFSLPGAAMGALAGNRSMQRRFRGTAAAPLLRGAQGRITGAFAGGALDTVASGLGVENPQFSRAGANLGMAGGIARGGTQFAAAKLPATSQLGRFARGATARGAAAQRDLSQFTDQTFHPYSVGGNLARRFVGKAPVPIAPARTLAQQAGRGVGNTGALLTAGGLGAAALDSRLTRTIDDQVGRVTGDLVPHLQGVAADTADQYLATRLPVLQQNLMGTADNYLGARGVLNAQGKIDPTAMVGAGLMARLDPLLQTLGIDTARLSPGQKLALVGGGAALGGGAAAGSLPVAALGGAALAGGAFPGQLQQLLQSFQNQPQSAPGRNEYLHQLQLQHPGPAGA